MSSEDGRSGENKWTSPAKQNVDVFDMNLSYLTHDCVLRHLQINLGDTLEILFGDSGIIADACFVDDDGKKKYMFSRKKFLQLKTLILKQLKKEIKEYPNVLSLEFDGLLEKSEACDSRKTLDKPLGSQNTTLASLSFIIVPAIIEVVRGIMALSDMEEVNKAKLLATHCANLNYALQDKPLGSDYVIVGDSFFDGFLSFGDFDSGFYSHVEATLGGIRAIGRKSPRGVIMMNEALTEFEERARPFSGLKNRLQFCFALNEVSSLVKEYQRSLINCDSVEMAESVVFLRRRVNSLMLEWCFHDKMTAPILDIASEYVVLCDNMKKTMFFLQRSQVKQFLDNVESDLRRRALDATGTLTDSCSSSDFKSAVSLVHSKDVNEEIKKLEREMEENRGEMRKKIVEAAFHGGKVAIDVIQRAAEILVSVLAAKQKKEFKMADVVSCVNHLKQKEKTGTESQPKGDKKSDAENGDKSDEKNGLTDLLEQAKMSDETLGMVQKSLLCAVEANNLFRLIQIKQQQIYYLKARCKRNATFTNLFALYIELAKLQLLDRNDYEGIAITENKGMLSDTGCAPLHMYRVTLLTCPRKKKRFLFLSFSIYWVLCVVNSSSFLIIRDDFSPSTNNHTLLLLSLYLDGTLHKITQYPFFMRDCGFSLL